MHSGYIYRGKITLKEACLVPGRHWVMIAKLAQAPAWIEDQSGENTT